jgi:transposase
LKKINPKTGKNELRVRLTKEFTPYFCPFCSVLFIENFNTFEIVNKPFSQEHKFSCSECKEIFIETTYADEMQKRRKYELPSLYDKNQDVNTLIKANILKLHQEGHSQRDIIQITKFSKSIIEEYTKAPKKALASISVKRFKKEYLKISDVIEKDLQIVSAIEFGCTVRQIQELFKVGNDRIERLRVNQKMKLLRKNKIKIEGQKVKIFKLS